MSAIVDLDGARATYVSARDEWRGNRLLADLLNTLVPGDEISTGVGNKAAYAAEQARRLLGAKVVHVDPTPPVQVNVEY